MNQQPDKCHKAAIVMTGHLKIPNTMANFVNKTHSTILPKLIIDNIVVNTAAQVIKFMVDNELLFKPSAIVDDMVKTFDKEPVDEQ
jgi:hypothetical protein